MMFLIVMMLCGAAVMKILNMVFQLGYESIWSAGFKVGFIAWLGLSVLMVTDKMRKKNNQ